MDPLTLLQGAKANVENYMVAMNDNVSKLESQKEMLEDQLQEIEGSIDILTDLKSTVSTYIQRVSTAPAPVVSSAPVTVQLPPVEEDNGEDDEVEFPESILNAVTNAARGN